MTPALLQQWLEHPECLDKDTVGELRAWVEQYPYFQSARLLYLLNLYQLHDAAFADELRKAAPFVADRRLLFYLTEGKACAPSSAVVQRTSSTPPHAVAEPGADRTQTLIDAFLANSPEKAEPSSPAGLDYAMDYTAYLLQGQTEAEDEASQKKDDAKVPPLRGQELIDGFIQGQTEERTEMRKGTAPSPKEENSTETSPAVSDVDAGDSLDESCFTETLAKIYIKQHRYEKALEIIKKLSLNYPKKNAYFADQIRFLEKLIINANSK